GFATMQRPATHQPKKLARLARNRRTLASAYLTDQPLSTRCTPLSVTEPTARAVNAPGSRCTIAASVCAVVAATVCVRSSNHGERSELTDCFRADRSTPPANAAFWRCSHALASRCVLNVAPSTYRRPCFTTARQRPEGSLRTAILSSSLVLQAKPRRPHDDSEDSNRPTRPNVAPSQTVATGRAMQDW